LNRPTVLLGTLGVLGLLITLSLLVPQAPAPPSDEAVYSRWYVELRAALGRSAELLSALGWLSIRTSWWQRTFLALLALVLSVRGTRLVERWTELPTLRRVWHLLILCGGFLILTGWGVQMVWGWTEAGVVAWPGERLNLAKHPVELPPLEGAPRIRAQGYGLYTLRQEVGAGLVVQAFGEDDEPVGLTAAVGSEPEQSLRLALDAGNRDAYFALPSAGYTFRANLQALAPERVILLQVYRSASGELLTETTFQNEGTLFAEGLRLRLDSVSLPHVRVVYNPGAPLTLVGWALLGVAGVTGPTRRRGEERNAG
jgi:hypothetical protein